MTESTYYRISYDALKNILIGGEYSGPAITSAIKRSEENRELVTKLIYGVLEKNIELDYIIGQITNKAPKNTVKLILKLGVYSLRYLSIPAYAVISECVNLANSLGKNGVGGFINATLKKAQERKYTLPKEGEEKYLEVKYNAPLWFIEILKSDYPESYQKILSTEGSNLEHIRLNPSRFDEEKLYELLSFRKVPYKKSIVGGYFVEYGQIIKTLVKEGKATVQSLTSMLAVDALEIKPEDTLLDMCAAPGGKSVYAASLGARVTANDVHEHRVELIRDYAKRMRVELTAEVKDGLILDKDYIGKFDKVLVDAPCSGFGVIRKRPDIFLNREAEDIKKLKNIQYKLLLNASKYIKSGGVIVYSTCTLLKDENDRVIERFLENNKDFVLEKIKIPFGNDGKIQFLPDNNGMDGFFIARIKRK